MQGVEVWNAWRRENPDIIPDLSRAKLSGVDRLSRANLRGVDLSEADLSRADLIKASLHEANLSGADLSRANLSQAGLGRARLSASPLFRTILRGANLSGANLDEADLSNSDLSSVDLRRSLLTGTNCRSADFIDANLSGAFLFEVALGDVDLTGATGLDSCRHIGPSMIDHRTLAKSGKLPIEFLRGCGLPDFIIDNIAELQGDPIQFHSCFISYSTKDQRFADRLYADLQNKGARCWFAAADMKIGDPIRKTIYDQIRVYEKLLLIFSEESVESGWVGDEVEAAFEEEKRRKHLMLFPIRLDDVVMETDTDWAAKIRRTRHIGDFTNWKDHDAYQEAFDRLMRDLKQEAKKGLSPQAGLD